MRYILKEKETGKELGVGEGTSHANVALKAGIKEYAQFEEVNEENGAQQVTHESSKRDQNQAQIGAPEKKPRKVRTPRVKGPDKPKRNRGQYWLVPESSLAGPFDRAMAENELSIHDGLALLRGRRLVPSCKKQWTFKEL